MIINNISGLVPVHIKTNETNTNFQELYSRFNTIEFAGISDYWDYLNIESVRFLDSNGTELARITYSKEPIRVQSFETQYGDTFDYISLPIMIDGHTVSIDNDLNDLLRNLGLLKDSNNDPFEYPGNYYLLTPEFRSEDSITLSNNCIKGLIKYLFDSYGAEPLYKSEYKLNDANILVNQSVPDQLSVNFINMDGTCILKSTDPETEELPIVESFNHIMFNWSDNPGINFTYSISGNTGIIFDSGSPLQEPYDVYLTFRHSMGSSTYVNYLLRLLLAAMGTHKYEVELPVQTNFTDVVFSDPTMENSLLGVDYQATIYPMSGQDIDVSSVTVYMGGVNITSQAVHSSSASEVRIGIDEVTGLITITASVLGPTPVEQYEVTYSLSGCESSNSASLVEAHSSYQSTITALNNYAPIGADLADVHIMMQNAETGSMDDITDSAYSITSIVGGELVGYINIIDVTGPLSIYINNPRTYNLSVNIINALSVDAPDFVVPGRDAIINYEAPSQFYTIDKNTVSISNAAYELGPDSVRLHDIGEGDVSFSAELVPSNYTIETNGVHCTINGDSNIVPGGQATLVINPNSDYGAPRSQEDVVVSNNVTYDFDPEEDPNAIHLSNPTGSTSVPISVTVTCHKYVQVEYNIEGASYEGPDYFATDSASDLEVTVTPVEGYLLPDPEDPSTGFISVFGASDYSWDLSTGTLTISPEDITEQNLGITIICHEIPSIITIPITTNITNGSVSEGSDTYIEMTQDEPGTAHLDFWTDEGYHLPSSIIIEAINEEGEPWPVSSDQYTYSEEGTIGYLNINIILADIGFTPIELRISIECISDNAEE